MSVTWTGQSLVGEDVAFRVGRLGDLLVAEWPGVATLRCNRDGRGATCDVDAGVAPALAEKLRRGLVPALLRHLTGELSLHASAAVREGVALAFLGAPSAGKSTIVAQLCRRGWRALADDILPLDPALRAVPSKPLLWLAPDARAFLGLPGPAPAPVEGVETATAVGAWVALRFADRPPALSRLHGVAAVRALAEAQIRFVLDEPAIHARDLRRLCDALERVPMYELVRPRALDRMSDSAVLLEAVVRDLACGNRRLAGGQCRRLAGGHS